MNKREKLKAELRAEIMRELFPIGEENVIIITMWKSLGRVSVGKLNEMDPSEFIWDYGKRPLLFMSVIEQLMEYEMKLGDVR